MCLITNKKRVKIAKEDISVFKLLKNNMTSLLFNKFQYISGDLNGTKIKKSLYRECFDGVEKEALLKIDKGFMKSDKFISIGAGFHSSLTEDRLEKAYDKIERKYYEYEIFKATIPKGSRYYVSPTGLVVSNQIIVH